MPDLLTLPAADDKPLDELYALFDRAIDAAEATHWAWADRARPYCQRAIETFRKFRRGEAGTPDVKHHFATLTTLGLEVVMTEVQEWAVLAIAEVAHAAAHLGHLVVAINRRGRPQVEYARLQAAYVQFGMLGAINYAEKVNAPAKADQSEAPANRPAKRIAA